MSERTLKSIPLSNFLLTQCIGKISRGMTVLRQLKIYFLHDPDIMFLRIYSKEVKSEYKKVTCNPQS